MKHERLFLWPMLLHRLHCSNMHTTSPCDCSLATPMITNIDSEASHAHVHGDALWWGVRSCLPPFNSPALQHVWPPFMRLCRAIRVHWSTVKNLCIHAWWYWGPALFFLCEADRLPVLVWFSIRAASSWTEARMKTEIFKFYYQPKSKVHVHMLVVTVWYQHYFSSYEPRETIFTHLRNASVVFLLLQLFKGCTRVVFYRLDIIRQLITMHSHGLEEVQIDFLNKFNYV